MMVMTNLCQKGNFESIGRCESNSVEVTKVKSIAERIGGWGGRFACQVGMTALTEDGFFSFVGFIDSDKLRMQVHVGRKVGVVGFVKGGRMDTAELVSEHSLCVSFVVSWNRQWWLGQFSLPSAELRFIQSQDLDCFGCQVFVQVNFVKRHLFGWEHSGTVSEPTSCTRQMGQSWDGGTVGKSLFDE